MELIDALDRSHSQKLYQQLLGIFKEKMSQGEWKVGTQIPTEEQLCAHYRVSRATVRLAIAELVSLGYLKRLQGKGTYVRRKRPDRSMPMLLNLDEAPTFPGVLSLTRPLDHSIVKAPGQIRELLGLAASDHCLRTASLVFIEGAPVLLNRCYLPYALLPSLIAVNEEDLSIHELVTVEGLSLYELLESRCRLKIQWIKELSDIAAAQGEEAVRLAIAEAHPVLRVRQIAYAAGDLPAGVSESLYRTDRYSRTVSLERLKI